MRYVAHQWDYVGHTWYVTDRQERLIGLADGIGQMTETEATMFAFALNAAAEGHELQYVTAEPDADGSNVFVYDGPTEGVAPAT